MTGQRPKGWSGYQLKLVDNECHLLDRSQFAGCFPKAANAPDEFQGVLCPALFFNWIVKVGSI